MLIQIVIKASNQTVPDVSVNCNDNWTVRRLKEEIAVQYPTKPSVEDQRLIFGGGFLNDDSLLIDALKQKHSGPDEPVTAHTIHLVCAQDAPSRVKVVPEARANKPVNSVVGEDGLRRRINSTGPPVNNPCPGNPTVPVPLMPNYQTEAEARAAYNAAMAWYMQHYRPYWEWYCQTYYGYTPPVPGAATPESGSVPEQPEARPAANNQLRMDAQGNAFMADDDEDDNAREWDILDWVYTIARFGVFLSFVYFYSNLTRFALVICAGLLLQYLHARLRNGNNNRAPRQNNPEPQQPPPQDPRVEDPVPNEPRPDPQPNPQTESEDAAEVEQAPQGLFAIWTFLYALLSSIFPEIPAN